MDYKDLRALQITYLGTWPSLIRVRLRRCGRCGTEWAEIRRFPVDLPQHLWPEKWDALLIRPGRSNSGASWAEVEAGIGIPAHPARGQAHEIFISGPIRIIPAAFVHGEWMNPIARWTATLPNYGKIELAALRDWPSIALPPLSEMDECAPCYRERIMSSAVYQQGNLFLVPVERGKYPRLYSEYQAGVEKILTFFGHSVDEPAYWLVRGDVATLVVPRGMSALIKHPHHPTICVGEGEYAAYHPYPRRGRD